jgi:hypothetical protein
MSFKTLLTYPFDFSHEIFRLTKSFKSEMVGIQMDLDRSECSNISEGHRNDNTETF